MTRKWEPNESGLCLCGCGAPTNVAKFDGGGYKPGEHYRYIKGHQHRKSPVLVIVDDDTGCWVWQGAAGGDSGKTGKCYGIMRVDAKYIAAHRHYYQLANGPIPKGLDIDHVCRNTLCVNPDHLEAVTHAENVRRGRATRLNRCQVELARALRSTGATVTELARMFDYPNGAMSNLLSGKSWSDAGGVL